MSGHHLSGVQGQLGWRDGGGNTRPILERALHKVDTLPVKDAGMPLDRRDGVVGLWQLGQALQLAVSAVSDAAAYSGAFLTYDQLQKQLNAKVHKPQPDDPEFDPSGISYDNDFEREVARQVRYRRTLQACETELRDTERIRRQFGYGWRNYLAYAEDAVGKLSADKTGADPTPNPLPAFFGAISVFAYS